MRSLLVVLLALSVFSSCGGDCRPTSARPVDVCIPASQTLAAGKAFTLRTTTYSGGAASVSCSTGFDGGSLTLTVDGTACSAGFNQPVARSNPADCTVGPLPAGTYEFTNLGRPITIFDGGFSIDGGLQDCF